jgi:hypothetical protein
LVPLVHEGFYLWQTAPDTLKNSVSILRVAPTEVEALLGTLAGLKLLDVDLMRPYNLSINSALLGKTLFIKSRGIPL